MCLAPVGCFFRLGCSFLMSSACRSDKVHTEASPWRKGDPTKSKTQFLPTPAGTKVISSLTIFRRFAHRVDFGKLSSHLHGSSILRVRTAPEIAFWRSGIESQLQVCIGSKLIHPPLRHKVFYGPVWEALRLRLEILAKSLTFRGPSCKKRQKPRSGTQRFS